MPIRKEPKEAVIYPASKRKPAPFKPVRPVKAPRIVEDIVDSDSDVVDSDEDEESERGGVAETGVRTSRSDIEISDEIDSDDLPDDPLKANNALKARPGNAQPSRNAPEAQVLKPLPDTYPTEIPQPLLLRLMHEFFESKDTRIDKHAIKVVQRYIECFLRETIARAEVSQQSDMAAGHASQSERGWLDRQDLEKICGGIALDF